MERRIRLRPIIFFGLIQLFGFLHPPVLHAKEGAQERNSLND
tara:strand:- start:71 stop:196 length:126 start_codon:yes stop_codon:yes gene_type:complete